MCLWQKDIKLLNNFSFHSYENGILNKDAVFLFHRKDLVILTYESERLSYEIKTLREDRTGAGCYNHNLCDLISAL